MESETLEPLAYTNEMSIAMWKTAAGFWGLSGGQPVKKFI